MTWNQDDVRRTRLADNKERSRAKRQAQLEVLHQRLVSEVERLVTGEDWRRALEFATRFRSRSFHNVLLIHRAQSDAFEQAWYQHRYQRTWPASAGGKASGAR